MSVTMIIISLKPMSLKQIHLLKKILVLMMKLINFVTRQLLLLFERKDVIIIASVSCIYGLGSPEEYQEMVVSLRVGMEKERNQLLRKLVDIQYERNDINFTRGTFRVRGDVVEIFPASRDEQCIRVEFFGDEIDRIREIDALTGEIIGEREHVAIFPASHFVTREEKMRLAIDNIEKELEEQLAKLQEAG